MLQKDWIRPETDADEVKRLYAGVFFLGVDETEGGVLRGRLGHLFFRKVYPFDGLDDAVLKMEALMDGLGCPPVTGTEGCSAAPAELCAQAQELDEDGVARCDGKKRSFLVTVTGRAHGTWQGSLVQVRKNRPNLRTRFVTTLQLMRLVREASGLPSG